jgi:hypothetical protein
MACSKALGGVGLETLIIRASSQFYLRDHWQLEIVAEQCVWHHLDDILTVSAFPKLQKVIIYLSFEAVATDLTARWTMLC